MTPETTSKTATRRGPLVLAAGGFELPIDGERLFGRAAPLVLEVGFGGGQFLLGLARSHPEWNLLGAEISPGSVVRARDLLRRADVSNAALYRGHARFLVRDALPPSSLTRVYVNFPDPWPKDRHAHHRLLQAPFLRLVSTRLVDAGELHFTTDHPEYFAQALAEAAETGLYRAEPGPAPPETLETKYARKWRALGKPIHHVRFVLVKRALPEPAPRVEIEPGMHYATLSGTLPEPESFDKSVRTFDGGTVVVLDLLRATRGGGFCFLVRVEEPDLVQELLVDARQTEPGHVYVGVRTFGQPLPTRGTREAVGMVTEWLVGQGLALLQRSY